MLAGLTIGKLAKEASVNSKTIRYYEQIGLLRRAQRNASGYRTYTGADLERLILIRRAKLLGLSLVETKELVDYAVDGRCAILESRLAKLLEDRMTEIDRKMEDLARLRADMRAYHGCLQARTSSKASQTVPPPPAVCRCIDGAEERVSDDKATATGLGTGRTGRRRRKEEIHERQGKEGTSICSSAT